MLYGNLVGWMMVVENGKWNFVDGGWKLQDGRWWKEYKEYEGIEEEV